MNFNALRLAATLFILTVTLIGAVACVPKQQAETTDVPTILIDNFDGNQLDPGQLLAGVEVVKLGNDSVIVGQVLDVEQMNSLLYVLDNTGNQLLCWDDSTFSVAYQYDFMKIGHDAAVPIEPGTESAYALNTSVWKLPGYVINSFLYKGLRYYGFYDCGQRQVVAGTLPQYECLPFYPQWATDELLIGCAGGFEDASHRIEADDVVLLLFTLK
jgi:hypothetical protein